MSQLQIQQTVVHVIVVQDITTLSMEKLPYETEYK